ncbi:253_t:CDS:1 [Acaulospora colombiana]|uniref:253_t:CDS:1 n=1 Tax=Acaulospora colombiana TaxID=27376 RepID=A0ACA9JW11_9GLOM|nr:253_t:CDS:1 [Acaulospora colombiana]
MPMQSILPKYQCENTAFLNAIYNFLEEAIAKVRTWLSPPVGKTKKIEIYLHFQSVKNDNPELLPSILQLDSSTISWSNICDYLCAHDFHKLLQACSGNDTIHMISSMNWTTEVFGGSIMDYDNTNRHKILTDARKMIQTSGQAIDPSGYFRYAQIFKHPHNTLTYFWQGM